MGVVLCNVIQDSLGFWILCQWNCGTWIPDSNSYRDSRLQIQDSLSWIPDSKAQDSTSYKQKFPYMGQVRARPPPSGHFLQQKEPWSFVNPSLSQD